MPLSPSRGRASLSLFQRCFARPMSGAAEDQARAGARKPSAGGRKFSFLRDTPGSAGPVLRGRRLARGARAHPVGGVPRAAEPALLRGGRVLGVLAAVCSTAGYEIGFPLSFAVYCTVAVKILQKTR